MKGETPALWPRQGALARLLYLTALPLTLLAKQDACAATTAETTGPIDRYAVVTRHDVHLSEPDPLTPLSVGNGEFCFTADVTGLQSFPEFHEDGMYLSGLAAGGGLEHPRTPPHRAGAGTKRCPVQTYPGCRPLLRSGRLVRQG